MSRALWSQNGAARDQIRDAGRGWGACPAISDKAINYGLQLNLNESAKKPLTTLSIRKQAHAYMQKMIAIGVALGLLGLFGQQQASAQGTVFTYQGKLNQNDVPFTGTAEIAPTLWDAASGGSQVAQNHPVTLLVDVSNGLFTASLDFGTTPFIAGAPRWLQLGVRTAFGPFTILSPLQPLTATPYAIAASYATKGGMATNFTGNLSGDVTGTQGATVVASLGGQSASAVVAGATAANAAVAASTPNTIVKRDGSGNFAAGAITATTLTGNGANLTSLSASNLTGTVPLTALSGITSNQLDAATWQFLVALASGGVNGPTTGTNGMVLIPGGSFTMGDTLDGDTAAKPVTNVYISPFFMDVNLVTWSQWQGVYGYATNHGYTFNPGAGKGAAHPVQLVNWYDVVKWCNARSEQAGMTPVYYTDVGLTVVYRTGEVAPYANWSAKGYRLPTEAEWEKAARGGLAGQRFPWGNLISQTNANYYGATGSYAYDLGPNGYHPLGNYPATSPGTSPVGSFAPNGYGLYDMAGNVWQWCWDWYGTPYAGGTDPRGVSTGSSRVLRGGGWSYGASICRSADRSSLDPARRLISGGFRSALPPGQ